VRKISILKSELKDLAELIRKSKSSLKDCQRRTGQAGEWEGQPGYSKYFNYISPVVNGKYQFRHKHIAYCMLRGRTIEQIEIPAKDNQPDLSYVERIKNDFSEENVCVGKTGSI
jgi:hypothetical protein